MILFSQNTTVLHENDIDYRFFFNSATLQYIFSMCISTIEGAFLNYFFYIFSFKTIRNIYEKLFNANVTTRLQI